MSTNYYWNPGPTSPLNPLAQLHIGKRSGGRSFTLQGFVFDGAAAQARAVEVGDGLFVQVTVPPLPAFAIKSWADWKQLVSQPDSSIEDEYGESCPSEAFIEMVESRRFLMNNFDMLDEPIDPAVNWKDSEGYAVTACDFS